MIHYRKSDGTLGECDPDRLYSVTVSGHTFTITLKYYGWDDYDFWYDEITDVVEMQIC